MRVAWKVVSDPGSIYKNLKGFNCHFQSICEWIVRLSLQFSYSVASVLAVNHRGRHCVTLWCVLHGKNYPDDILEHVM